MTGCQDRDDVAGENDVALDQVIRIGGISTDGLVATATVTRADPVDEETVLRTDAENISWLVTPLKDGLDITYGNYDSDWHRKNSRVAILKLLTEEGGGIKYSVDGNKQYAEYSFLYRDDTTGAPTDNPAIWYDNGTHFFEGLYVPTKIQYTSDNASAVYGSGGTAPNLTTDQHDDNTAEGFLGNYTLLSRYLGMPSGFTLNATVARVKLPFRHRLARVLAYILIDPDMGEGVTIQGYTATNEDATTSKIRFCNVKVLAGVKDSYNQTTQHHTYTPQWKEERKAIPHFVGERGSYNDSNNQSLDDNHFVAFYDTQKKEYIYPTDATWTTIKNSFPAITGSETEADNIVGNYERTIYGKVPVYDLIVRPTYTELNRVMYDEDLTGGKSKQDYYAATNQIEFEITLNNGLQYSKVFNFDLDANYQTVVYLHITRERVDYNSSGSDLWVESIGYDDWYGVNNQNGNTLSYAGSSWQRAYTCGTIPAGTEHPNNFDDVVTDGHFYKYDSEDEKAQYVTDAKWIEMFAQAHEGGEHHGDYFILHHDISIPASALPDNFVFTGHLDGMDHTITLTGTSFQREVTAAYDSYETYDDASETKYIESEGNYVAFTADPNATYCEKVGNDYSVISIDSYSGSVAYIRTLDHNDEIYTAIDKPETPDPQTTYYTKVGDNYEPINWETYQEGTQVYTKSIVPVYTYTAITFFKKVHHNAVMETINRGYLFAGLNGKYTTAQEADASATWEANVHKEKVGNTEYWVPYTNGTDGWRAEIINTNIDGGTLFPSTAVYGSDVTGYVHNCWIGGTFSGTPPKWSGTKVQDYTPSLPEY